MAIISLPAVLALLAGLFFAVQAVAVEKGVEDARRSVSGSTTRLAALVNVVVSMVLFWLIVLLRGGITSEVPLAGVLVFLAIGIGYPALFRLLYFRGIERVGPSIASATITANPVVAAVLAVLLLDEVITPPVVVGTVLIIGGGVLLQHKYNSVRSRSAADGGAVGDSDMDVLARKLASAELMDLLALLGATVIVGGAYVAISYGLSIFPDPVTATAITQTSAAVALVAYFAVFDRGMLTRSVSRDSLTSSYMALFTLAGVFVALAWLGQFFALGLGTVTTVVPIIYVYPLFLIVYAYGTARQYPRSYEIVLGITAIVIGASLVEIF